MARSFEEYQARGGGTKGCPRCGGPTKAGAVTIRLLEFADGNSSRFDQVASRQISMCENCTVEVYETLVSDLNDQANGGSRPLKAEPSPTRSTQRRRRTAKRS